MNDAIVVKTKIYEIGNKSVKLVQVLYDENTESVKSVCRTIMCGFDPKTNTSLQISKEWRDLIYNYEKFHP
jgi:acyl-CoA thioester hydrolase